MRFVRPSLLGGLVLALFVPALFTACGSSASTGGGGLVGSGDDADGSVPGDDATAGDDGSVVPDGSGGDDGSTNCKSPTAPSGTWFSEVTTAVGLGSSDTPEALGTAVYAADFDGDGYMDLIATTTSLRDTPTAPHHYLLMNRVSLDDPTKRMFVQSYVGSGLEATRDGLGNRGFTNVFIGDLDNDGDDDVITCPAAPNASVLDACGAFLNDGTAHFTLAPSSDLDSFMADVEGGALFDFDQDGLLDFWPGTRGGKPSLFHGHGDGTFTDVAAAMGLPQVSGAEADSLSFRQTLGVTVCDLDDDGDSDVLLADYGREHNQVWLNHSGTLFTEHGVELGLANDGNNDYTQDDQSYLCYCQAHPGYCSPSAPAPTYTCPDRGWYPGSSDQDWRLGGVNFSFACGDPDNDGRWDLMVATIHHPDVGSDADPTELIVNNTPPNSYLQPFVRPGNSVTGLTRGGQEFTNDVGDMGIFFADLDLDGRQDIYLTSSDYDGDQGWFWQNTGGLHFEEKTDTAGIGQPEIHGATMFDYDNDGDLDLAAGTSMVRGVAPNNALRIYQNDIGAASNWLQLKLVGLGAGHSNRSAIGARVKVTVGSTTQMQEVHGGYAISGLQNGYVLTFGLGDACAADIVEVRWPDGQATVQTFTHVPANRRGRITEWQSTIEY